MLETNMFRTMMLVGGVMVLATLLYCFFAAPLIAIDQGSKVSYEKVMNEDLGDKTHLTGYQALWFSIKGIDRGSVQHY